MSAFWNFKPLNELITYLIALVCIYQENLIWNDMKHMKSFTPYNLINWPNTRTELLHFFWSSAFCFCLYSSFPINNSGSLFKVEISVSPYPSGWSWVYPLVCDTIKRGWLRGIDCKKYLKARKDRSLIFIRIYSKIVCSVKCLDCHSEIEFQCQITESDFFILYFCHRTLAQLLTLPAWPSVSRSSSKQRRIREHSSIMSACFP